MTSYVSFGKFKLCEMFSYVCIVLCWSGLILAESQFPLPFANSGHFPYAHNAYYVLSNGRPDLHRTPLLQQLLQHPQLPLRADTPHYGAGQAVVPRPHIIVPLHGPANFPHFLVKHQNGGSRLPISVESSIEQGSYAGAMERPLVGDDSLWQVPLTIQPAVFRRRDYLLKNRGECRSSTFAGEIGICYKHHECAAKGGRAYHPCSAFGSEKCCLFQKDCSSTSSEMVTYFRNPSYPENELITKNCRLTIRKAQDRICGVKVHVRYMDGPKQSVFCGEKYFRVSGNPDKSFDAICAATGDTYGVRFGSANTLEFDMGHTDMLDLTTSWHIQISQADDCSSLAPWPTRSPSESSQAGVPFPEIENEKPFKEPNPASAAATPLDAAGGALKGLSLQNGVKCGQHFTENSANPATLRSEQSSSPLAWAAPELEESLFYKLTFNTESLLTDRITKGIVTLKQEFPWQVAILSRSFGTEKFHCGASVITDEFILTAAHCVKGFEKKPWSLKLLFGDYAMGSTEDFHDITSPVESVQPHEHFSFSTLSHDIGLIKLKKKLVFSDRIQPACLPAKDLTDEKLLTLTGWGRNEKNRLQKFLMKLSAAPVPYDACRKKWRDTYGYDLIKPGMMCLNTQLGDSCKGDSGGPCGVSSDGQFIQVALVSFGSKTCLDPDLPGVYTKIYDHMDWIRTTMKAMKKTK